MTYKIFGPFAITRQSEDEDHRETMNRFWSAREAENLKHLETAIGTYVWIYKDGRKDVPWNVGLTNTGFRKRFYQKESTFLRLHLDKGPLQISVYLLALQTAGGKFAKPRRDLEINDWLESMLIRSALKVNPELRNSAKVQKLKNTKVEGYLNDGDGELSSAAKSFKNLFPD